jgi:hypothetical protein
MFKAVNNGKYNEQIVGEANIVAPFSTIQNRAKVEANCKVVGPVERIRVNSLKEVPNEFGPNGEKVYTSDKEDSRVRFVGSWVTPYDSNGTRPFANVTDDSFIEVSFYGTGLNLLGIIEAPWDNLVMQVDGVPTSFTNASVATVSNVLNNRNYSQNAIFNAISGLTEAWHTVKILKNNQAFSWDMFGFEILNASSDLSVLSGSVFKNGYEYILENDSTLPIIPIGYTGSNGARVINYIDPSDGQAKQAFNEVGTPAYLGATDHSNEAIYRRINFREFGRNRADDFSTLGPSSSDRAFTLDDGVTTLVGNDVTENTVTEGSFLNHGSNNTSFTTITFVGTGLDLIVRFIDTESSSSYEVLVDGVSVGFLIPQNSGHMKICSGLPYGTHTVKIRRLTATVISLGISDFIIYRTKKPTLPKEAFILSDYNVVADYVFNSDNDTLDISTGTIMKSVAREFIFSGSWAITTADTDSVSGHRLISTTNGNTCEYTFVGTGFEHNYWATLNAATIQYSINGVPLTSTNFPNVVVQTTAGLTFNSTTGQVSGTPNATGSKVSITGLDFEKHTLLLEKISGSEIEVDALSIISPIHSPNTSIGNLSLEDTRLPKLSEGVKTVFDLSGSNVASSNKISQILRTGVGDFLIYYEDAFLSTSEKILNIDSNAFHSIVNGSGSNPSSDSCAIRNSSNNGQDTGRIILRVDGRLQKDVFKD